MSVEQYIKTNVALVKIGKLAFEGLMDEKGAFFIAQQQIATLFSVIPTSAPKWLKNKLGKDFQLFSVKTNRNEGTRQNRAEKAIGLIDFERLLRKLDKAGNPIAESIVDDMVGVALHQLFCDAFEIEFNQRDRQAWLENRQKSKEAFWDLGDASKSYIALHQERSDKYRQHVFSNCQNTLNRGLFDKDASTIREELGVKDLLRNHYGKIALKRIELIQSLASANIIHRDIEPLAAVKEALSMYNFETIDYKE